MNARISGLIWLALLGSLAACASGPRTQTYVENGEFVRFDPDKDPYWTDPSWTASLFRAVQSAVHDTVDSNTSTPGLHTVVKFIYLGGAIEYPEIVQSTGDPKKDDLLLHQLASAQLPQATGVDADKPHEFVLDLDMPTPFEAFEYSVVAAIDYAKVYPKEAIIHGDQGLAIVSFDYLDGKAGNIAITQPSHNKYLDRASIQAVTRANLPMPPATYTGMTLHMQQVFCYSLNGLGNCPTRRDVIQVHGTRIMGRGA